MKKAISILIRHFVLLIVLSLCIQSRVIAQVAPIDWFTEDFSQTKIFGTGIDRAYTDLLAGMKSVPVIVAVIDGGVDYQHEDLKSVMWVNPKEIAGNGIDDDKNGYVDDMHGWNFIGNVSGDTYEVTRTYAALKGKYEGKSEKDISSKDKKEYDQFLKAKEKVETSLKFAQAQLDQLKQTQQMLEGPLKAVATKIGDQKLTPELIDTLDAGDNMDLLMGKMILQQVLASDDIKVDNMDQLNSLMMEELKGAIDHYSNEVNYSYNIDFDPRKTIVKDNFEDYNERFYGNNDVKGPDASHGTHVAGIIGADRTNNLGIKGIANNVRIMAVRAVPNGDERDKDVANAIRYAVDNGAKVINMSFGKGISPGKKYVDEAVKYAADHDVLLVHAAGNNAENNDSVESFPSATYLTPLNKSKFAPNWIEVGAMDFRGQPADFSNFGIKNVDIFAPGVDIYATMPDNKYKNNSGTSMASPVVAGVAAVIRSYFPNLTAVQVKQVLMASSSKEENKVANPKTKLMVDFKSLSVSGGYVNAYDAVKEAAKLSKVKLSNTKP